MASAMKRPMLGYGYMGFWHGGIQGESFNVSVANNWAVSGAHNGFLNVWLTLGVLGIVLVLYSFMKALHDGIFCITNGGSPYFDWCLCIVLLTILHGMDETQIMAPNDLTWILYILACIGLSEGVKRIRSAR